MMNLFFSFDPSTKMNLSLSWMSIILELMVLPAMFWITPSQINFLWIKLWLTLSNKFKVILKIKEMKSTTLIFVF